MTIFGLNSPELFLLLVITLVILGTKRIEKGLDLFSRLMKFLLSNQGKFDKKELSAKEIEGTQKKKEEIKIEETTNAKEKDQIKEIEGTQEKKNKSKKEVKIVNVENKEKKSAKIKDSKKIVNDKAVKKSKIINVQEEQIDK